MSRIIKYLFLFLFFLTFSVWFLFFSFQGNFLKAYFFDVGSGDAILLKTPDNFKILIDGGPSAEILNYLGKTLGPFDRKIDFLILTHPHQDHLFGTLEVLDKYNVGMVLGTGVIHTSQTYLDFLEKVKKKNINFVIAEQGQIFKFGDLEIEVLYPFESLAGRKIKNLNDSSIIFKAKFKKVKFLFLGDAEKEVAERLLNNNVDLRAEILKVSHQGSKNGAQNLNGFLEKVKPFIAVILVGENRFGHPHKETLEILEKKKIKTLRTDQNGTIEIEADGQSFWIKENNKL